MYLCPSCCIWVSHVGQRAVIMTHIIRLSHYVGADAQGHVTPTHVL